MFTERFIKVPIKLFNTEEKELMDKKEYECEMIDIFVRINPFKIVSYRPAIPEELSFEKESQTCVQIRLDNDDGFLVYMNIDDFEKLLNNWSDV